MYQEIFPTKLKEARIKSGYTQQQVATFLKVSRVNITNYEIGRTQPDIETLAKLIDFYEVSADWILGTGINKK